MKPYYSEPGITIYHGDCRDILPSLPKVDLVLTDPPYGIADKWVGGKGHGWGKAREQGVLRNVWDHKPDMRLFYEIFKVSESQIIWGGNYFKLPPSRCWFVFNKPERGFSLAEAELAWTSKDAVIRVCDCNRSEYDREHPTQKPLRLFTWCLQQFPNAQTILDPFMGSGTTLRAAKDLGRKAIGIEIEEKYCEIAVKRLRQEVLPLA